MKGFLPTNQILPRLKVCAHFLDFSYGTSHNRRVGQLLADMDACIDSLPNTHWAWLSGLFDEAFSNEAEGIFQVMGFFALDNTKEGKDALIFRTKHSVGSSHSFSLPGDAIVAIDGAQHPFLLREVGPQEYRIVGKCYFWARTTIVITGSVAQVVPEAGTSYEASERTQFIEIY
jgi:hypothetical protein